MLSDEYITCCGGRSYSRTPANVIAPFGGDPNKIREVYTALSERTAERPDEGYYVLHNPIFLNASVAITQNGDFLNDTVADVPATEATRLSIEAAPQIGLGDLGGNPGDPYVFISKPGFRNYGHFLTDIAPKLVNVRKAGFLTVNLVLAEGSRKFLPLIEALCSALGLDVRILFCPNGYSITGPEVLYFGSVQKHNRYKSKTLREMRDLILSCAGPAAVREQEKILILRDVSEVRAFQNSMELVDIAKSFGVRAIHPGDFTWLEQVSIFSSASHVIGGLGAGLTNILFAPEHASVLMVDPGFAGYYFWDISCLANQSFTFIFSGPISPYSKKLAEGEISLSGELLSFWLEAQLRS